MVSWKIALVVIVIAILVVAIGMWFGYQYVSEQDDLPSAGWRELSEIPNLCRDTSCMFALTLREAFCCNVTFFKHNSIFSTLYEKRRFKI